MLRITFENIKNSEPDYNRRQTLIKTVTNAEKLAKARERSNFLINCRRKNIIPKFIQRKTRTLSDIFPNNRQVEAIRLNFMRKLLNEAIKTTFRTVAFLQRESYRLAKLRQMEKHPLTPLVEENAKMVYLEATLQSKNTLKNKLSDLCRQREHEHSTNQQEEERKHEERGREERVAYSQEEEGRQEAQERQEGVTYSIEEKKRQEQQERENRDICDQEEKVMKAQVEVERVYDQGEEKRQEEQDREEGVSKNREEERKEENSDQKSYSSAYSQDDTADKLTLATHEMQAHGQQEYDTSQEAQDEAQYSTETMNSKNSGTDNSAPKPARNYTLQTPLKSVSRVAAARQPEEQNVRGTAEADGTPSHYGIDRRDRERDSYSLSHCGRATSLRDTTYVSTTPLCGGYAKGCHTTDGEVAADASTDRDDDWRDALFCCKFSNECICSSVDVRSVGSRGTISGALTYAQTLDISDLIWFNARLCACANAVVCPLVDQRPQVTFEAACSCPVNISVGGPATYNLDRDGVWMGALLCCNDSNECICSSVRNFDSKVTMSRTPAHTQSSDISDPTCYNARLGVCSGVAKCRLGDGAPAGPR